MLHLIIMKTRLTKKDLDVTMTTLKELRASLPQ